MYADAEGGQDAFLESETLFTCADGSGTFTLTLFVTLHPDFTAVFDWTVKDGTGTYAGLRGQGTGTSVPTTFPLKREIYAGQMTID